MVSAAPANHASRVLQIKVHTSLYVIGDLPAGPRGEEWAMVEMRRGPGRPAYGSKQKLVDAACALLAERGFEATSPQMFQQRSGVGHGSMYHHFPGKGKEGLALDAISHMRASTIAFLDGSPTPEGSEVEEVRASIVTALDRLFARKEGQALVRLLADAVAGALPSLATATQDWCDDIRAVIVVRLRADEPDADLDIADAAARFLAPEFAALAEELLTAALGRGLLHLPKFALPETAEER